MFSITQQAADMIYSLSNVLLVLGAILALLGTAGVFWSGGVRERYSDQRIAANEAETAKAKAETAQALLEQERLRAEMSWRRVTPEQAHQLAVALRGEPKQVWLAWVGNDPEATVFREDLNAALGAAGIETKYFSGYARAVGLTVSGGTQADRSRLLSAFHSARLPLKESDEESLMKGEL